jgi:hypothetical protein
MYSFRGKKIEIWEKNNYVKDLWKYGSFFTIQNYLIKIWSWFLREDFHIKVYHLMLHHILSHYKFGMEFNMNLFFSTINNLIIIGLMYNQFQILNLISFIINYKCPKKGHFAKMGTVIQKVSHHNVHSPLH